MMYKYYIYIVDRRCMNKYYSYNLDVDVWINIILITWMWMY